MVLLLGIILIVLGILVFAFRGFFGVFPDNWEWVGIILAGVGLIMGTPSVLQMIMGRPRLMICFDRLVRNQERSLGIFLKNPPLGKKSNWRKLGVKRDTIESLIVSFCVTEVGTGKIKTQPIMHAKIYSDDDPTHIGKNRIALPPTITYEASVMIAMWDESKKKAIIPGDTLRSYIELSVGVYQIEVIFVVDGDPQIEFRRFNVGVKADDLEWLPLNQSEIHKKGSQN